MNLNGVVTKGRKREHVLRIESEIIFNSSVKGKTVLDIGAWDGFFSFEAERLGAKSVLATDYHCWSGPGWGTKDGFDTAHHYLNSKVQSKEIDILDILPSSVGKWDIVLLLGVLYHLKHPFLALERVSSIVKECLILETLLDMIDVDYPAARFYPGREKHNDPTNWWGLNRACIESMLKILQFGRVDFTRHPLSKNPDTERAIFHAYR